MKNKRIAYSVERIAYSKERSIFFKSLSAKRYPLNAKNGFTLIELFIVSVIMGVVSLALFGVFNSGIKIWQRMNKAVMNEEVNIFLSKFIRDASNGFQFAAVNFAGGAQEARFATLLYSSQLEKRTVGEVAYAYHQGTLERRERDFSQIYNEREESFEPVLNNLDFCKFIYYAYDKEAKDYFWKESWAQEQVPLAIRIELGYKDEMGSHAVSRTVNFPASK